MAIRSDSYSSTTEVKTFTYHLLDGQSTFNSTTRPTLTEVEKFIDRASAVLNGALYGAGFSTPLTANTTAKLMCDDWVTEQVVQAAELTAVGLSTFGELDEGRPRLFANLAGKADKFVKANALALKRLGVTVAHARSEGLMFTGETAVNDRADPDDDSLRPHRFHAEMFEKDTTAS